MNGDKRSYCEALDRLWAYLEDSLNSGHCPDDDACHVGIDAISRQKKAIEAGEEPWKEYDLGEDTQDLSGPMLEDVAAEKVIITLQRGYPQPQRDDEEPNIHSQIQDGVGVEDL